MPRRSNTDSGNAQTSTDGSVSTPQPTKLQTQIIEGRYMDLKKMKALLTKKHGSEWMLEVKLDRWVISAPGKLTDDEIDELSS